MPIEIIESHANFVRFRVDQCALDTFASHRIKTPWQIGDIVAAAPSMPLEAYVEYRNPREIYECGAFSYSFSPLAFGMKIGRYCSISWGVRPMGPQHAYQFVSNSEILYQPNSQFSQALADRGVEWQFLPNPQKPASIVQNDVWIGQDVILSPGITLGHGCVVGAGAIVTKSIEPFAIVGGNPARLIKYRFPEDIREKLLDIQWWNYAIPDMAGMPFDSPDRFISEMQEKIASGVLAPIRPIGTVAEVLGISPS